MRTAPFAPNEQSTVVCADLAIRGTLHSVDQYLNVKLLNVTVEDASNFPHMVRRQPAGHSGRTSAAGRGLSGACGVDYSTSVHRVHLPRSNR